MSGRWGHESGPNSSQNCTCNTIDNKSVSARYIENMLTFTTSPPANRHRSPTFRLEQSRPFRPLYVGGNGNTYENNDELKEPLNGEKKMGTTTAIVLFSIVILWVTIIVVVSVLYYKVSSTLEWAQLYTQPHMYAAINHTMSLLRNADHAATGANRVVDDVHSLTDATVPALQNALQQSASIVDRLERLARNPTIQLRLGEGQP